MLIIGCDFHTRYQQIAMVDTATGELTEQRLNHESGEGRVLMLCDVAPSSLYRAQPDDTMAMS